MMSTYGMSSKFSQPDMPVMLSASESEAIQQIINCTSTLVELALNARWGEVLDGMDTRRRMLQELIETTPDPCSEQMLALQAAVQESERALMRVIAHAIASAQLHGAEFAMYH